MGRSELDLARRLRVLVLEAGGDDVAFDVIVGSGPNGALPHARPGDRAVEEGDSVVVDFGVLSGGYRSDVARTVHVGEVPAELTEIFDICLQAHLKAIARIVPGMSGVEADAIARSVIEEAGYGNDFGHGLGHGVGRDIHEAPFLSKISTDSLEAGQIVAIEPGIYLAGTRRCSDRGPMHRPRRRARVGHHSPQARHSRLTAMASTHEPAHDPVHLGWPPPLTAPSLPSSTPG